MVKLEPKTGDCCVWEKDKLLVDTLAAMQTKLPLYIDLRSEGPAFDQLDLASPLLQMCELQGYPVDKILIETCNLVEDNTDFEFKIVPPMHFVENTQQKLHNKFTTKNIQYTFGHFIGRSNAPRLYLASHLFAYHKDKTLQTFHYDSTLDFHRANLGLDTMTEMFGASSLLAAESLLMHCPIKSTDAVEYPMLMNQHCNIAPQYQNFFVDIVCETYFSGNTFFPTEKTWRPIVMQTPFLMQGPKYFLARLRELGFQTFNEWWDEGYDQDETCYALQEIVKIIDTLSSEDVRAMYSEMSEVLEHNHKHFLSLTEDDFEVFRNAK